MKWIFEIEKAALYYQEPQKNKEQKILFCEDLQKVKMKNEVGNLN